MATYTTNKSSIDFLLSGAQDVDVCAIEPRTAPATNNPKRRTIKRPKNPQLSLKLLQQPIHAKVSTHPSGRVFFSEHRPIHPPPVLQLCVQDFTPASTRELLTEELLNGLGTYKDPKTVEIIRELEIIKRMRAHRVAPWVHYSTFFVVARLQMATGEKTLPSRLYNAHTDQTEEVSDLLIGTNVASGMPLPLSINTSTNSHLTLLPLEKMDPNNYAITFVFSDLAVRKVGKFKLKFDLFEVFQGRVSKRAELFSDEFQIYTPKKFPGSSVSSPLTSFLYNHGARIRQRKRSTSSKRTTSMTTTSDRGSNSGDEVETSPADESTSMQKQRRISSIEDQSSVTSIGGTPQQLPLLPSVSHFRDPAPQGQQQHQAQRPFYLPFMSHKYMPPPPHVAHHMHLPGPPGVPPGVPPQPQPQGHFIYAPPPPPQATSIGPHPHLSHHHMAGPDPNINVNANVNINCTSHSLPPMHPHSTFTVPDHITRAQGVQYYPPPTGATYPKAPIRSSSPSANAQTSNLPYL